MSGGCKATSVVTITAANFMEAVKSLDDIPCPTEGRIGNAATDAIITWTMPFGAPTSPRTVPKTGAPTPAATRDANSGTPFAELAWWTTVLVAGTVAALGLM